MLRLEIFAIPCLKRIHIYQKMPLPWHSHKNRNFSCMKTIVSDIVSDGLRTIFKQEWDSRYRATLGAWNNTSINGREMHNIEKQGTKKRKSEKWKYKRMGLYSALQRNPLFKFHRQSWLKSYHSKRGRHSKANEE